MKISARCLAIYDWDSKSHCSRIYRSVSEYFIAGDFSIEDCFLLVSGWPKSKRLDPDRVEEIIQDMSDIKSIEGHFINASGAEAYFLISGNSSSAPIIFIRMPDQFESRHSLELLIESLAASAFLAYGYVFSWDAEEDPAFYALGITHVGAGGVIDSEQADADERWFNERVLTRGARRYRDSGMFRGVYETNVINIQHLERVIGGEKLAEVIKSRGWGEVKRISDENWLWKTTNHDRDEIAAHFKAEGLLVG